MKKIILLTLIIVGISSESYSNALHSACRSRYSNIENENKRERKISRCIRKAEKELKKTEKKEIKEREKKAKQAEKNLERQKRKDKKDAAKEERREERDREKEEKNLEKIEEGQKKYACKKECMGLKGKDRRQCERDCKYGKKPSKSDERKEARIKKGETKYACKEECLGFKGKDKRDCERACKYGREFTPKTTSNPVAKVEEVETVTIPITTAPKVETTETAASKQELQEAIVETSPEVLQAIEVERTINETGVIPTQSQTKYSVCNQTFYGDEAEEKRNTYDACKNGLMVKYDVKDPMANSSVEDNMKRMMEEMDGERKSYSDVLRECCSRI